MFPPVDTKDAARVGQHVLGSYTALFPGESAVTLARLFADTEALFAGQHPDYGPVDLHYHDLEHTLQATLCLAQLLTGCARVGGPTVSARQYQLAIAAVLLHDAGYLKLRSDTGGTGAKYTFCHVLRSCAFAASYLPQLGANEDEISGVLGAINCTGPTKEIGRLHFRTSTERFIGCALATADYLGQMAAADYPDELALLYAEFSESDDFIHVPPASRMFTSTNDLADRTPAFWRHVVQPKLAHDFESAYRFLATAFPDGPNPYVEAVERNIAVIEQRNAARRAGAR